jgi:hypothetical protein
MFQQAGLRFPPPPCGHLPRVAGEEKIFSLPPLAGEVPPQGAKGVRGIAYF